MVVTVAVISTAEIAKAKVIPALESSSTAASLVAVSSRDKKRAQAFINENCCSSSKRDNDAYENNERVVVGMTHDEVLSSAASIDAVYVPLPSRVRNDMLRNAIHHGKHIYSEKPHGGSIQEFKSILDLAQAKNLQWMDGTMWYHSNRTKAMEEQRQCLGNVRRVSASFTWGGGGLVDTDWIEGGNGRTDPKRERMGMLGDSGHYPISAAAWAFGWKLPWKVQATHTKFNSVGAIVECEAVLWFENGGRAIIDTSCLLPHRSQFEMVCEKGVLKVDDLVGGQGRSGNFGAYEGPFVGSSSFVMGDYLGKDTIINAQACDHVQSLVNAFSQCVETIQKGGKADPEWSKRSLITHTIMCAVFESAMRSGTSIELRKNSDSASEEYEYIIDGAAFDDLPTMAWEKNES